jgi:GNAT superfamily N-acetyltransferase
MGQMIGFARATSDGVLSATIWDVAILPAWQRCGLGRALMERLTARLVEDGIPTITLVGGTITDSFREHHRSGKITCRCMLGCWGRLVEDGLPTITLVGGTIREFLYCRAGGIIPCTCLHACWGTRSGWKRMGYPP